MKSGTKIAVITGSAGGLGKEFAEKLLASGQQKKKPLYLFSKLKRKGQDLMQCKDSPSRKKTNKLPIFCCKLLVQLKL